MKWSKLVSAGHSPVARSSHSITAAGSLIYLFGGELSPRVPVDNDLYIYDLVEGNPPSPRIAHTAAVVGDQLYIFGGRNGIGMGEGGMNDMHRFDVGKHRWEEVKTLEGDAPSPRSYHTMLALGTKLYVFGGCSDHGRLNDLHSFDTVTCSWQRLPSSDSIAERGGSCLSASADGKSLYVIAGFCGHELNDMHRFDIPTSSWDCPACCSAATALPSRSVFGTSVHNCSSCSHANHLFAFGGEIDPSTKGHEGAGDFTDDAFCYDQEHGWHKMQVPGDGPCPRGWFASTTTPDGCMVVHGGLNNDNNRLDDMFILRMHE